MKKLTLFVLLTVATAASWGLPSQIVCKAENTLDPVSKFGNVTFSFEPLTASWVGADGRSKKLFDQNIICGRDISNTPVKLSCLFEDKSDSYLRYNLSCDTHYPSGTTQWFARGGLAVSDVTKNGRFECRTKYGSNMSVILNLTSCK